MCARGRGKEGREARQGANRAFEGVRGDVPGPTRAHHAATFFMDPNGWVKGSTAEGTVYYYNVRTKGAGACRASRGSLVDGSAHALTLSESSWTEPDGYVDQELEATRAAEAAEKEAKDKVGTACPPPLLLLLPRATSGLLWAWRRRRTRTAGKPLKRR